jgi:hypothetical protein
LNLRPSIAGSNKISFAVAAVYDRRHAEYQDKMATHLDTPANEGRANLLVCLNLTASKRSDASVVSH